jgi:hypothetical protein
VALRSNVAAEKAAHETTFESLNRTLAELAACTEARARIADAGRDAEERLSAELQDTQAALAMLAERTARAARDPACAVCIDAPICPALRSTP